jgi:hypothetical protein
MANQLRAHLQTTFPGVIGLFRDIDSAISLRFLTRFPGQDKAEWLSSVRLGNWLRSVGYNHLANLDRMWAHLDNAPHGTTGTQATPRAEITLALVATLTALRTQIKTLEGQIADQLAAHPDAAIFTSLPKSGTVRAARLLAEIGDARGRFPTPEALACLAGAAPSTKQSGKVKVVAFRWAVDNNSAAQSSTSPATPTTPTPGPPTSTTAPEHAVTTTPTPSGSSPEPGSTSSGDAGKTMRPTTPTSTAHYNDSNSRRLDTGLLMPLSVRVGIPVSRHCPGGLRGQTHSLGIVGYQLRLTAMNLSTSQGRSPPSLDQPGVIGSGLRSTIKVRG